MANLNALKMRMGPGKKGNKAKSPKPEKKGKEKTTWDPFVFGGRGATGEEAKNLVSRNARVPLTGHQL